MIYGSYNGKVNFIEPMITTEYLLSNEEVSLNYSQPEYFEKAGTIQRSITYIMISLPGKFILP
jgi:hypothetical protein